MGKLTEEEIRHIIKRASVFQNFERQSPHKSAHFIDEDYQTLFEIADNLQVERKHIQEAIIEYFGVETEDPVSLDTNNQTDIKIKATANGYVDGTTLNEIRANLEYHFNTVGKISRRNKRIFWKASPTGPSILFSITNSPELEISQDKTRATFTLKQDFSTLNKLFFFPTIASLGAIMMTTAVMYNQVGGDGAIPMLIMSGFFVTASFFFTRFVKRRKIKRKEKLIELLGTLQQTVERHFRISTPQVKKKERISIPDLDEIDEELTVTSGAKVNT